MRQEFKSFIDDLKSAHGENLAAVILYGSAATGEFVARQSNYNLLIALGQIAPADLRAAQAPMREWKRLGHPLPTYFTIAELRDAADVFPIEFHQIERARTVLYGVDPFAEVTISDAHLRHQTEYELRSKLLQLRRLYIPASVSTEKLRELMSDSLSSFAAIFRAVLLLDGVEPPTLKRDVIRVTAERAGIDALPFNTIFALSTSDAPKLNETDANKLFGNYLSQIERVIEFVDKMERES